MTNRKEPTQSFPRLNNIKLIQTTGKLILFVHRTVPDLLWHRKAPNPNSRHNVCFQANDPKSMDFEICSLRPDCLLNGESEGEHEEERRYNKLPLIAAFTILKTCKTCQRAVCLGSRVARAGPDIHFRRPFGPVRYKIRYHLILGKQKRTKI